jgi:hypothetical protein
MNSQEQPAKKPTTSKGPFAKPLWWSFFLSATILMSLWFRTFKAFTLHPTMATGSLWLLVMLFLLLNIVILAYDSYLNEKGKGNIHKPVRLFEWLHSRRFLIFPPASSKEAV